MDQTPTGFFVLTRDDGFGDVHPLIPGSRYPIGRAPSNRIVLKDDLCSRNHAEIFSTGDQWVIRDLGSLNGVTINEQPRKGDSQLKPRDAVRLGRAVYLFLESLEQLPSLPELTRKSDETEGVAITKRLGQTKYLPTVPPPTDATITMPPVGQAPKVERPTTTVALSILYRLALEMGEAQVSSELAEMVLTALLQATPSEVGAVLQLRDGGKELDTVAYQARPSFRSGYHKVSQFVSREVLASKQAVLAEDIGENDRLKKRESVADIRATSLICAPILHEGKSLGLLHLYHTGKDEHLNTDDLEFALAVAQQLGTAWQRLRKQTGLSVENRVLKDQLKLDSELVGQSGPLRKIEDQIQRVASTKATVLIRGESGVGKELVARAIHFSSSRKDSPMVCLNCAALTETLLESELFGHEKGAFTGATERMMGKFEAANHGTIFLDEIGEMGLSTQAKLLRVLEGHPFERVGGNTPIQVDVRVVAATNRPLEEAVREGTFRKDLYFRLQVVQLDVPPLRDRVDDIPLIAEHFLKRYSREMGRKIRGFTPAALSKLTSYRWPGNVRELKNVIERAVALSNQAMIDDSDIWLSPLELLEVKADPVEFEPQSLEKLEKEHIIRTLQHTDWNKSRTAEILGIERSTLDRKIKAYEIKK
ncbi:MAG: sigma 54-interacting transcriptional regulator [Fimbriiglobus sp.]